jgi:hypothetical protein
MDASKRILVEIKLLQNLMKRLPAILVLKEKYSEKMILMITSEK